MYVEATVKGKADPLRACTGPWGSGRLRLPDLLDVRHSEGGRSSALSTDRRYPQEYPGTHF